MSIPYRLAGAVTALALATLAVPAAAQERIRVGTLACNVSGNVGLIVASQRSVNCTFAPANGRREIYTGRITRYGLDVGVTGPGALVWAVFAPTNRMARGQLAGTYVGGSAEATLGVGAGANVLLGGSNNTVALQPLSAEAQTGLNLAVGVSGFQLARLR